MSAKNVEVVRDALDAFGAADTERLLQFMDPEIEFEPHLALLEGNYRGHDGVREFEEQRHWMHERYLERAAASGSPWVLVEGPQAARLQESSSAVDQLLAGR